MNLTVDVGNTRVKRALFDGDRLCGVPAEGEECRAERAIVCATGHCNPAALLLGTERVHLLSSRSRLPIAIDYDTPDTLGPDRIAAACGAWKLCGETGEDSLIIDAGTCVTIDLLDAAGTYHGGAILPGLDMKYRALHTFTAKLPLLSQADEAELPLAGKTTRESIAAGVLLATRFAVEGFVAHHRRRSPSLRLIATGGDAVRLCGGMEGCTVEPHLVMIGLNEILKYNE